MKKVTKYYVTFWTPGIFIGESWTEDVKTPDPAKVKWPENAYAFTLHQRDDVVDGKKVFKGDPKQIGPMYYHPDSKVETLEQVKRNPNATDILVRNMQGNRWDKIIWTRWRNWPQPYEEGKTVVLAA